MNINMITLDEIAQSGFIINWSFRKGVKMSETDEEARAWREQTGVGREMSRASLAKWTKGFWEPLGQFQRAFKEQVENHWTSPHPRMTDPDAISEMLAARGKRQPKAPARTGGVCRVLDAGDFYAFQSWAADRVREHERIVDKMDAELPAELARLKTLLGPKFNPTDYPDTMIGVVTFNWSYDPIPTGAFFPRVLPQKEREEFEARYIECIRQVTRAEYQERLLAPLEVLFDALTREGKNGKNVRIADSLFTNVKEAFTRVIATDPLKDKTLVNLAAKVREELMLDHPEAVKTDPVVKGHVAKKASSAMAEILGTIKP